MLNKSFGPYEKSKWVGVLMGKKKGDDGRMRRRSYIMSNTPHRDPSIWSGSCERGTTTPIVAET
jgi:hypothetical protein